LLLLSRYHTSVRPVRPCQAPPLQYIPKPLSTFLHLYFFTCTTALPAHHSFSHGYGSAHRIHRQAPITSLVAACFWSLFGFCPGQSPLWHSQQLHGIGHILFSWFHGYWLTKEHFKNSKCIEYNARLGQGN